MTRRSHALQDQSSTDGLKVKGTDSQSRIRDSVSVQMCGVLLLVYSSLGVLGGNLFTLDFGLPTITYGCSTWDGVASYFLQNNCLIMRGWIWMIFTSLFVHLNVLHLGGNLLFLLIFGTALEEKVSRMRWLVVFFTSGLTGNLAFLAIGPILGGNVGLGASGAIYGLLGAAGGMRGAFLVIILLGLNVFSGGGEVAHIAGLIAGLVWHRWGDYLSGILSGGEVAPRRD